MEPEQDRAAHHDVEEKRGDDSEGTKETGGERRPGHRVIMKLEAGYADRGSRRLAVNLDGGFLRVRYGRYYNRMLYKGSRGLFKQGFR
jgi:hypothetical protein